MKPILDIYSLQFQEDMTPIGFSENWVDVQVTYENLVPSRMLTQIDYRSAYLYQSNGGFVNRILLSIHA